MPLCITWAVFQLNETMFWCNDCRLKGFLCLYFWTLATCCISYSYKKWSQCRSLRPDSSVCWQNCSPQGKLPQGEVHTVVILVCLHYVRFKAAVPCLQHCQEYSCRTVVLLKIFVKRVWTTFVLIKTGNVLQGNIWACLSNQMPTLDGCREMSVLCYLPLSN